MRRSKIPWIVILHESDGRPYFAAVEELARKAGGTVSYYETSVIRIIAKTIIQRKDFRRQVVRSMRNLGFRFKQFFIAPHAVIYAAPPFDFRIIYFLWLLFFRPKVRVIYHSSWPTWQGPVPRNPFVFGWVVRCLYRRLIISPRVETVATIGAVENSMHCFLNSEASSIHVIPHCVDFVGAGTAKCVARQTIRRQIGFVGKLVPEKGVRNFIKLAEQMGSFGDFVVAGDGILREEVGSAAAQGFLTYLGWLDRKEISDLFANLDVLIVPSIRKANWEELFGVVIIEALRSGVVVIASDHIGPRELIANGENGFLVPESDLAAIRSALDAVISCERTLARMREKAIHSAARFSIEKVQRMWSRLDAFSSL